MLEDSNDSELSVDSFEKFLRSQKLDEWPETDKKYVQMVVEYPYSEVEEVEEILRTKVPFPVDIATSVSTLVDEMWEKVKKHNDILSAAAVSGPKGDTPQIMDHPYPELVEKAHMKLKEKVKTAPMCPDIMDLKFPGISNLQRTNIPGLPDISKHLDRISEAQVFNPGFLKIWKPFFLSEHSIIVFKDTFWWFFLHCFKPSLEDESVLFDSIATGFVALLLMVHNDVKDKVFKVYADCLAQAIYAAFCGAFPQSRQRFGDDFKKVLTEVISLWVSGIKPKHFSWKNWKLHWLTPVNYAVKPKKKSVGDFQLDLNERIAKALRSGVVQTPTSATRIGFGAAGAEAGSYPISHKSQYIGPGPQFDHIYFKPWGQSPLVARYLQLHGIPSTAGSSTRKVKRTEMVATVLPEKPTFQDVISETQGKINTWRGMYNQFSQKTSTAISGLHRKKQVKLMELDRLGKQLLTSRPETEVFSKAVMDKWHHATYYTGHRLELCISQRSDSDESLQTEESPKASEESGEQA